jgi:prepilin-type processing-associated H-X9-DG protein
MGLAAQNYHDVRMGFPCGGYYNYMAYGYQFNNISSAAGITVTGAPLPGPNQQGGWPLFILPYMEGDNLYNTTSLTTLLGSPSKVFYCPSRRSPQVATNGLATVDYYGANGLSPQAVAGTNMGGNNGPIAINGRAAVTIVQISDGSSNTMLFGEKNLCLPALNQGTDYCDWAGYTWGADSGSSGAWDNTMGNALVQPQQDLTAISGCGSTSPIQGTHGFGSSHVGAFNTVFCDGHVQPIQYSVNINTFYWLTQINDGQVIDFTTF